MEPRVTKTNIEVDKSLVMDVCCENDCGMSIMVDKRDKDMGRKSRCTACIMRAKTLIPPAL